jgi:uncharacterized protein YlxW (UPF0749 family)
VLTAKFADFDNQGSTANYDLLEKDNKQLKSRVAEL